MVSPSSIRYQDEGTKESTGYPLRQSDFGYWLAFKLLRINHMNLGHNYFFIMHPRANPTTVHCGTVFLKDRNTPIAEAVLLEIMVLDLHQVLVIEFLLISRYNAHIIERSRSIYSHCDQLPQFRRSLWVTSERSIPIPIEVPIAMSFQRGDARNSPQSQMFSSVQEISSHKSPRIPFNSRKKRRPVSRSSVVSASSCENDSHHSIKSSKLNRSGQFAEALLLNPSFYRLQALNIMKLPTMPNEQTFQLIQAREVW